LTTTEVENILIETFHENINGRVFVVSIYEQLKPDMDKISYLLFVDGRFNSTYKRLPSRRVIQHVAERCASKPF